MQEQNYYANLYYFRKISRIGGTEQFLYEMAKKYHGYDLTILYDDADFDQLMRLKKLVRCIRRKRGVVYHAEKAFYNFNIEAIEQIQAKEHIFVCHAVYQEQAFEPPIDHPKLTAILAVSKYAEESIKKQEEDFGVSLPIIQCYNPLQLEPQEKVLKIVSACRLDDKTKGGNRTRKLVEALDRYCEKSGKHYLWTIFSNSMNDSIISDNVAVMRPRIDVRAYIADADWLVQVSNNMETYCYSINEALGYGTKVVRTPLSVAKELKIPEQAELVLDWDCENVDEIAIKMFEKYDDFKYNPPKDRWDKILASVPANYEYVRNDVRVKAIKRYYDLELGCYVSNWTNSWLTSIERAKELSDKGLIRILE